MLKTANLIGSVLTAFGYFVTLMGLAVSQVNAVVVFAGLMFMGLWVINLAGVIIGIILCVKETKSVVAWLGLASHVCQIILTVGLMLIGMISSV